MPGAHCRNHTPFPAEVNPLLGALADLLPVTGTSGYPHGLLANISHEELLAAMLSRGVRADRVITDPPWMPPASPVADQRKLSNVISNHHALRMLADSIIATVMAMTNVAVIFAGDEFAMAVTAASRGYCTPRLLVWQKNVGRVMA